MQLKTFVHSLAAGLIACATALPLTAGGARAGDVRLAYVGAPETAGQPVTGSGLSVLHLPGLPQQGEADQQVLAALLRSNPVSTFAPTPDAALGAQTGDLHLVIELELLAPDETGARRVRLADETLALGDLSPRLEAVISAFSPEQRQIAYFHIADPEDRFAAFLPELRRTVDPAGFAISVLTVSSGAGGCAEALPPVEYSLLAGLADRAPFGDADGTTTVSEAMGWISAGLERGSRRGGLCAARYGLILRGADLDRPVVRSDEAPVFPQMETALYGERFQALFLMSSDNETPIRDFLESCTYCPKEAALTERLQDIGERKLALQLETTIWDDIREDAEPGRIKVYLENCQLCAFRDEAEARILTLDTAAAARAKENAAFAALSAARDLPGLQDWLEACVACDFRPEAVALIGELENDSRVQAELAALDTAIERQNAGEISAWLEGCEICAGRDRAEAALERAAAMETANRPCISAAGLPQQGGPRLLSEIAPVAARVACESAEAAFPGNPLALTLLGRVAQVDGDIAAARAGYQAGVDAGLPLAYGLAAHSFFAPGAGESADYDRADELAREGYARGDWLSGEVLTVLYSRDLIAGRTVTDALDIAQAQAEAGNPVAQFFVGYFHLVGAGVEPDEAIAAQWLEKAVAQGYLHANSFLAEIYERGGDTVVADPERSADLYWSALMGGDPTALERLSNQLSERPNAVVMAVQTRLREAGAFAGRVDGIAGNNTATAVRNYAATLASAG